MISSDRANIDPALLLLSPRAGYYYSLQVYHQINVWRKLSGHDTGPLKLGMENQQWGVLFNFD